MKRVTMCYFVFSTIIFGSCNLKNGMNKHLLIKNSLIEKPGKYLSNEFDMELSIDIENNVLGFNIKDTAGRILFDTVPFKASSFQKWFFVIDEHGNVWVNSSDVGLYFLKRQDKGFQITKPLNHNNLSIRLPEIVYNNLPNAIKNKINR